MDITQKNFNLAKGSESRTLLLELYNSEMHLRAFANNFDPTKLDKLELLQKLAKSMDSLSKKQGSTAHTRQGDRRTGSRGLPTVRESVPEVFDTHHMRDFVDELGFTDLMVLVDVSSILFKSELHSNHVHRTLS